MNFLKNQSFVSLLLLLMAVIFGADVSMAMADTSGATADSKGMKTDLTGTVASGTQVREGELAEEEIDETIAKFRPFLFPLDTDFRRETRQVPVKGYEIEHYASGASLLDCVTNSEVNNSGKAKIVVLPVADNFRKMFSVGATILVPEVDGYAPDDTDGTKKLGKLMLVVTEKTSTEVKVEALNGPINSGNMYVPNISSGSKLNVCANACTESQMHVDPENYQPRPSTVYLQKKIVNIVMTDHFKEIVKKVPFFEDDLKDNALYNFRRKCARTLWVGVKSKRKIEVSGMGEEYAYTSEGAIPQLRSMYGINDTLTYEDLIGICKMQFTTYSANNEANAYCGKNFMEKLLNIDFTKHKDVSFTANTVLGIDIKAFQTTFGRLNFKYDPTLDDIGFEDYCAVIDVKNACRYVMVDNKEQRVDMKEGAGENREATRDIHTQIDCMALKGFNSILVGPSDALMAMAGSRKTVVATSGAELPASPTDKQIFLLTEAKEGWAANSLLQYDASTKTWAEYAGEIIA